jgi:tRNA-dihydrouridine synthase C
VRVQLLGSDPACMADNAAQLARLNPAGIDLNFGCPAPTVNRHRGGAALLDEPELLHAIACAVRRAVPPHIPFTAKMRLGVADTGKALDCARALADGGVVAWWCMPAPRTTATARRPTGNGSGASPTWWRCRWWPTARCGPRTTGGAAAR